MHDIVRAVRALTKSPGFTLTAIAALALGIGANSAIFSVIDAVILQPLSYPDPGRIVQFASYPDGGVTTVSATRFNIWRQQTALFDDIAIYDWRPLHLSLGGGAQREQISGLRASANYFRLFGANVLEGRTFSPEEDSPGGAHVAVIGYGFLQRRFGGTPAMLGRPIVLNGIAYSVIGILNANFAPEAPCDVWIPFQLDPNSTDHAQNMFAAARLKPGVTLSQANAQLQAAAQEFRRKFPGFMDARDGFLVRPMQQVLTGEVQPALFVLAAAVGFVLLIACANVASLLLVRATGRKREIAVRVALGAKRFHIVRQVLAESLALFLAGGACGVLLGIAGLRALLAIRPGDIPRIGEAGAGLSLDWRVFAFTLLLSVVTGVVSGLIPALGVSGLDVTTALKEGGDRGGTGLQHNRIRSVLVVAEVALSLMLLTGAAIVIRSFVALRSVDPGFETHHLLTIPIAVAGTPFTETARVAQLVQDGEQRLTALAGVEGAGASYCMPLMGTFGLPFNIVGRQPASGRYEGRGWVPVSSGYFETLRIPLLRGRLFTPRDNASGAPVAIINQALARKFWPQGDPLADQLQIAKGYGPEFVEPPRQITGIVGDVHNWGLDTPAVPMVYVPVAQMTNGVAGVLARNAPLIWMVRTRLERRSIVPTLERELRQLTGGLPITQIRTMDEVSMQSTARADFNMLLLTIFGAVATLLAAIGIYGLMAYAVSQRTQEIAIRMALGARPADMTRLIVGQGMRLTGIGIALGLGGAVALSRVLVSSLAGVTRPEPWVFVAAPALLALVGLGAMWRPARRAAGIPPGDALRQV